MFLSNAQGVDTEICAQRMYDIVAPAIAAAAVKETGKGQDGRRRRDCAAYAGTLRRAASRAARSPSSPGRTGSRCSAPDDGPGGGLVKLKKTGEHTFRRVRKDGKLGEEVVFEMGPDGRPTRLVKRHSNCSPRVR